MTALNRCEACGAPQTAPTDGRHAVCSYCGAEAELAVDSGQLARGLALDLSNADGFMQRLSTALSEGFGTRAKIRREGTQVLAIELTLDPDIFVAKREHERVVGQHKKVVRGIALKTATLPLDRWVELLTAAIADHANTSASAARALAQLRVR
jgi:hypothetical protein